MQGTSVPGWRAAGAAAFAVVLVAPVVTYLAVARLSTANAWLTHTHAVRSDLTGVLSVLQDAETGQRGFLITGSTQDLLPYRTARRVLPARLTRLDALTRDNGEQQRLLAELRPRAAAKLRELRGGIMARRRHGFTAAQRVVREGVGRRQMDRIRDVIAEMMRNEDVLFAARTREVEAASLAARLSFGLTVFLALASVVVVYRLARRQLGQASTLAEARGRAAESQARLAAIVESSDDAIVGKTLDGIVTSWNRGAERVFGFTAEEMIGQPISKLIPSDRPNDLATVLGAVRRGQRVEHYETERIRKNGERIAVSLTVSPVRDAAGRIIGASKVARDVTDRKRAEEHTRNLAAFNQAIVTHVGEGLYTVDAKGALTSINPAGERMFGWSGPELLGRSMHEATHYKRPDGTPFPAAECPGLQVLKTGNPLKDQEDVFIRKDGTFFPVVYSCTLIPSDSGPAKLVVVFRDVSRQREAEADRETLLALAERRRTEAEAASQAKDAFLATVSHELRTPLSPILAWSRMLGQGRLDADKAVRAVATIERCAKAQAQLVDDLLDVSRIVSGKLRIEVRSVDLAPVVQAAVEVVRPSADAKGIALDAVLDPRAGRVSGDPDRLQQVVWNLLSNAVKFTPGGGRVRVVLEKVDSYVQIAVSDTGQGIPPEFIPHVFERFQQADPTTSRAHAGLGLGLAIVRHIVELHGGTVHVQSPGPGQGALFTVRLPVIVLERAHDATARHPPVPVPADSAPYASLAGLRVLVVDDDPDSNEVVRALLTSCGAEVDVAASAAQALDALGGFRPDVLVSDVGMPGEDGFALIRSIRAGNGNRTRHVPAVALTAYTSIEDRVRLLSAGFQAHVTKPLDPSELVAVVASLARDADLV